MLLVFLIYFFVIISPCFLVSYLLLYTISLFPTFFSLILPFDFPVIPIFFISISIALGWWSCLLLGTSYCHCCWRFISLIYMANIGCQSWPPTWWFVLYNLAHMELKVLGMSLYLLPKISVVPIRICIWLYIASYMSAHPLCCLFLLPLVITLLESWLSLFYSILFYFLVFSVESLLMRDLS